MLGDCLELMMDIPAKSIEMILCDLPYGTTKNKWDEIIPFDKLWLAYTRIIKDNGAIVLTSSQPFTTKLISSNYKLFRYCNVWDKVGTTGFQTSNVMPLKRHEDICVFYKNKPTYNPQMTIRGRERIKGGSKIDNGCYGDLRSTKSFNNTYYPTSIIVSSNASKKGLFHPTQKPVPLFEYLIKTYTNEGDTVLDNCAGSGTTALACINTNRNYILIEKEEKYFNVINERVKNHDKQ